MKNKFEIKEENINWKGSYSDGRIFIYLPSHPNAVGKHVRRSRLVMEKYIGRFLLKKEVVHHINGNTQDDRIENLILFKNQSAHLKMHNKNRLKE